jgi:hypothetical protein
MRARRANERTSFNPCLAPVIAAIEAAEEWPRQCIFFEAE